jgi:hypothetical protein
VLYDLIGDTNGNLDDSGFGELVIH